MEENKMTRKLTATYEGQTFKRSTDRNYTYVVIGRYNSGDVQALSWAGSYDLATKRLNEFKRYNDLKIIPVNQGAN